MPTTAEYTARIREVNNSGLQEMLVKIGRGENLDGWAAGKGLEYVVLRQFEIEGAAVTWPFEVKIDQQVVEQIDGAVYTEGLACLVECKDRRDSINIEPIAKLRNQLHRRPPGTLGLIFARDGYTPPAKMLARYMAPMSILLWEFAELAYALERETLRSGLLMKYRHAVEHGLPDFNLVTGTFE